MKKINLLIVMLGLFVASCSSKYSELGDGLFADIQTTKGEIIVKLTYDKTPVTVANFVTLAEGTNPFVTDSIKGKKYYDGVIFHRVIEDFMIQSGDPTGQGNGNPGYKFKDEFDKSLSHDKKGILSMANAGFGTNGSQFFITHKATKFLDAYDERGNIKPCENPRVSCHAVFGEVVKGLDVIDSIATTETNPQDRPLDSIVMNNIKIIRNGKEAKSFDAVQVFTDYFEEANKKAEEARKAAEDLAKEIEAQLPEAEETESGLKYIVLEKGTDEKPKEGDTVLVNYAGYFTDGLLFDTSWLDVAEKMNAVQQSKLRRNGYQPFPTALSLDAQLVAGFKEGLFLMNYGDKIRLFIPSHLAYGTTGSGPIPPNTDLVFDLQITKPQE
ncbi:peptidylprolyl isomerase [Zhouia amylolytica]|uniref:peptidylprolyl isomerase n=1 Tax=Zhouia amylolytica AD3 TaxID=1286632 RepID=W2UPG9_9FLAO|nr:peptidylprolyl isomerase [Zhouia amylolytica]ETN96080.1 PpiA protein [Zhouia amylolytica AD3]